MKILILGGTGAMGAHAVSLLSDTDNDVYVTSRVTRLSYGNINYVKCNARIDDELESILNIKEWDCIIDFMQYKTPEFEKKSDRLLKAAKHYIFLSSARVYAESETMLTESSARLSDTCKDNEYLMTDEYALAKARQEDILKNKSKINWTIIRPYITYSEQRLQLGFYEKEQWLYRALNGKTVVMDKNIASRATTLTYARDVAERIISLINREETFGEVFQIASSEVKTWREITDIYIKALRDVAGINMKVKYIDNIFDANIKKIPTTQIKYDRLYNRSFDSAKIKSFSGLNTYMDLETGIQQCISGFISNPQFKKIDWVYEANMDRITGNFTAMNEIHGKKNKLKYLLYRLGIK